MAPDSKGLVEMAMPLQSLYQVRLDVYLQVGMIRFSYALPVRLSLKTLQGMGKMKTAFYKAEGLLFNKLIRWWTRSNYSHTELAINGQSYPAPERKGELANSINKSTFPHSVRIHCHAQE